MRESEIAPCGQSGTDTTQHNASVESTRSSRQSARSQAVEDDQQYNQTDQLLFVPVTNNEAARGRGTSHRMVRAHITRARHAKSNTLSAMLSLRPWNVQQYVPDKQGGKKSKGGKSKTAPEETTKAEPLKSTSKQPSPTTSSSNSSRTTPSSNSSGPQAETSSNSSGTLAETSSKHRDLDVVPYLISGSQHDDPFWTYPVEHHVSLPPLFAHYIERIAVEIPDLDGPTQRGVLRRQWFPLAMTESATMYAVLLMAGSHYSVVNPSQADRIDLLHLKARALSEINCALANRSRALSDPIIGAVMKMAAYEAVFGSSEIYAAHMRGLALMIQMRGGLSQLGLNGLLERMVVWIDTNAAHVTGLSRTMGGKHLPTAVEFIADPYHFTGLS